MLIGMRSDASKLSLSDYNYIMQYKNEKSKPLNILTKKFHISNRRLYQIWRGEEVYTGETLICLNNRNGPLTNSISKDNFTAYPHLVNTSIIETKEHSAKSIINGQEKKKKSRSKSHHEQSSDMKHLNELVRDCLRANIQYDTSRKDALQSSGLCPRSDQVPADKNLSLDTKLTKLQKGTKQIKHIS
ncbi:unnamed protein product [Rhizophagus irregularis]|nr:unnamed protein product [Rhizophagus irregularis]